MNRNIMFQAVLFGLIIGVDQITKLIARQYLSHQLNTGGIFSLGKGFNWQLITLLVFVLITFRIRRWNSLEKLEKIGWLVILASGISNFLDRLLFGGVWDWIYYPFIGIVGNIADITLGLGIILLLFVDFKLHQKIFPNKTS